jgi:hypothetical protein
MSEPKSNGEIEDVLSSIRRLVAEEGKPGAPVPPAAEAGKLILTPALRVVADPEEAEPPPDAEATVVLSSGTAEPASELAPEPATEPAPAAGEASPPDLVASIGAATDLDAREWESETGDAWSAERDAPEVAALMRTAAIEVPVQPGAPSGAEDADPFAVAPEAPVAAADPFEALSAAPDDGAEARPPVVMAEGDDPWPDAVPEPEIAEASAGITHDVPDAAVAARPPEPGPVPEAAAAALQDVPPAAVPDGDLPAAAFVRPGPRTAGATPPFFGLEDEDGPFDEEALRDLVREAIREELQGPLGERITRNLRKLVRAEVQRALATKALE